MDDYEKGYISISSRFDTSDEVKRVVAHEYAHYLFRQSYAKCSLKIGYTRKQLEDLKEILTVLHRPVLKLHDKGYKMYQVQRQQALKLWRKYHDLERLIARLDINKT